MKSVHRFIAVAATCLALSAVPGAERVAGADAAPQAAHGPIVEAPAGAVEGRLQDAIRVFKGIPYAAPPVGPLRWRPPQAAATWSGVRDATEFGAPCIQPPAGAPNLYTSDIGRASEDCLSLNIWTPADAHNSKVFGWIHGGSPSGG